MTKPLSEAATGAEGAQEKKGFVHDWVLPVVLGLAIGGAAVGAWNVGKKLFHSDAWNLASEWSLESEDGNEALEGSLRGLGTSARADLVSTLRDLPGDQPDSLERKLWVARLLAGEPWYDTTSLKEIVRDTAAPAIDRRACAAALVEVQQKEVDAELVLPVIEEWLGDAAGGDRDIAVGLVDQIWGWGMLSSAWEERVRKALVAIASVKPPPDADVQTLPQDRPFALYALRLALPSDEIRTLLFGAAADDADPDFDARVNAVRALAEKGVLDEADLPEWEKVMKSKEGIVRQAAVDNMDKARLPSYDKIIEPMQWDERELGRSGALKVQIKRRRPTMLPRFDELIEDSDEWVRFDTMFSAGVFKDHTDGLAARAAMILRVLETSENEVDVKAAVLAMKMLTGEVYGLDAQDVHVQQQEVEDAPLAAFMKDTDGRKDAAAKWRERFGAGCVWTDDDRAKTLEKLLTHADPENVERAKIELAKLKPPR